MALAPDEFAPRDPPPHGRVTEAAQAVSDSPIVSAAFGQKDELVRTLVYEGADVNAVGTLAEPALRWLVSRGKRSLVQLLVSHGADANIAETDKWLPLHFTPNSSHSYNRGEMLMANTLLRAGTVLTWLNKSGDRAIDLDKHSGAPKYINVYLRTIYYYIVLLRAARRVYCLAARGLPSLVMDKIVMALLLADRHVDVFNNGGGDCEERLPLKHRHNVYHYVRGAPLRGLSRWRFSQCAYYGAAITLGDDNEYDDAPPPPHVGGGD